MLVVTLNRDFPTPAEAKAAVQPTLDAWEARSDIEYSPGEFRLQFEGHEMAMRNPPPPGTLVGVAAFMELGTLRAVITGTTAPPIRRTYPAPPIDFSLTPDVRSLHDRIVAGIEGREPIASLAYFCLTVAESVAPAPPTTMPRKPSRRRTAAAAQLAIDYTTLEMLGDLSSEYGGADGRKASSTKAFTDDHHRWLRAVNREIFERLCAYAAGKQLKQLTMKDLPNF